MARTLSSFTATEATSQISFPLAIPGGVFVPGSQVTFRIGANIKDATSLALYSYSEIVLTVNSPPSGGVVTSVPATGSPLDSDFALLSASWFDNPTDRDKRPRSIHSADLSMHGRIRTRSPICREPPQRFEYQCVEPSHGAAPHGCQHLEESSLDATLSVATKPSPFNRSRSCRRVQCPKGARPKTSDGLKSSLSQSHSHSTLPLRPHSQRRPAIRCQRPRRRSSTPVICHKRSSATARRPRR